MKICDITHPDYAANELKWQLYRDVMSGGSEFIDKYVIQLSRLETNEDFLDRKSITYCPAHAKAAVIRVCNAIFQRMVDISRVNGPQNYQDAVAGKNRGVDRSGNTMSAFVGTQVLKEMLSMKRVGVYIDKPVIPAGALKSQVLDKTPYLYCYIAENIRSWRYDDKNQLISVLLRDNIEDVDPLTGLVVGMVSRYRLLTKVNNGVVIQYYNEKGDEDGSPLLINIPEIPFVMCEIQESLLTDIAGHQVALVNMVSADLAYCLKSNFPFYTEQFDQASEMMAVKATNSSENKPGEVRVGATQGRRYPKNLDRPQFIHPSSEPLYASMDKQASTINEITMLLALNINNIRSVRAAKVPYSSDVKQDSAGLEAGLPAIGLELEACEQSIARIWELYEGISSSKVTIKYPRTYNLRSDAERRSEADELITLGQKVPSKTFKRVVYRQAANLLIGAISSVDDLNTVNKEINDAEVLVTDPEVIKSDLEAGLVGNKLASELRGYPEGEYKIAEDDHARRAARIAEAQSKAAASARGVDDLSESKGGSAEKKVSRDTTLDDTSEDKTRGEGE